MATAQLRLVQDAPLPQAGISQDPVRLLFEHWLFMLGKSPARCKLGPTRRRALSAALTLYDADTLRLAIEGMACDPWCGGDNRTGRPMFDLEWLLASEDRIEKFADAGDAARLQAQREEVDRQAQASQPPPAADAPDPAAAAASRERYRELLARMRNA